LFGYQIIILGGVCCTCPPIWYYHLFSVDMKKVSRRNLIIIIFWTAIMIIAWLNDEKELPFGERIFSLTVFAVVSILISISVSKTLFKTTVANRKTLPFILKYVSLNISFFIFYFLLYKLLYFLEINGLFNSTFFIERNEALLSAMIEDMPGMLAVTLLFCGILLYYEYSELQNTNLKYHLQILHSQINPHFMFNVLNHIYILMEKDTDMASVLLLKYSDTLRYQLYAGKEEWVKLDKEIVFLKNYIDVEKFRWEGKLDVECLWHIEDGNKDIPPLLLITFIENAFKHVSRSQSEKGFIYIALKQDENILSLEVRNSKSDGKKKVKSSGIGLENVKKRLDILYRRRYSLDIEDIGSVYSTKLMIKI